jgi:prepilin-type N-terminal cleavage/methylation domain-containing protein
MGSFAHWSCLRIRSIADNKPLHVIHAMNSRRQTQAPPVRHGFTLVEMLVAIVMIAALAAVVISVTQRVRENAKASIRLSNIRQAGNVLLGIAADRNGRCSYFSGGNGNFEYRHYLMVRSELGWTGNGPVEIMHWDSKKRPPAAGNTHWNCRAINFKNVSYPDGTSTRWINESVKDATGTGGTVKSLSLAAVARPSFYPLLIDSSRSGGGEIFRIDEGGGDCVGLREAGGTKASAFFFDGSARFMGKTELKNAGFTKAFDNSKTPPVPITL